MTKKSNDVLFGVVENLLQVAESGAPQRWSNAQLDGLRRIFLEELLRERDGFVGLDQESMLRTLHPERGPMAARA